MSHAKERKEKNCLNCNAIVAGRYCQVCGQENIETQETFGHLTGHFISDIFHFDGLFFSTAKQLLFHPGSLTYEYVRGRRASYLNPIKMYVFISAIFFLFFLTVYKPNIHLNENEKRNVTAKQVMESLQDTRDDLNKMIADNNIPASSMVRQKLSLVNKDIAILQKDTTRKLEFLNEVNGFLVSDLASIRFSDSGGYNSVGQYDSIQQKLPKNKRDSWLNQKYKKKKLDLENRFRENKNETVNVFLESFLHHFPQMLFISLPLFALLLQLLYIRRKQFYYANHIIFTVHLYSAVFILIFLMLLIDKIVGLPYLHWLKYVSYAISLYTVFYTYKAMRTFYKQGRIKTIVKWILLNSAAFFIMLGLFVLLLFFTMFVV